MKPEHIFLAVVTLGAIIYYAKFDKFKPDHSEFGADYTSYSYNGDPLDPEEVETVDDL